MKRQGEQGHDEKPGMDSGVAIKTQVETQDAPVV